MKFKCSLILVFILCNSSYSGEEFPINPKLIRYEYEVTPVYSSIIVEFDMRVCNGLSALGSINLRVDNDVSVSKIPIKHCYIPDLESLYLSYEIDSHSNKFIYLKIKGYLIDAYGMSEEVFVGIISKNEKVVEFSYHKEGETDNGQSISDFY